MKQIVGKNVSVGYGMKAVAHHLDFSIEQGDYLCIIGENGAGKTTLIKTLLGLKKPLGGEIIFDEGLEKQGIGYLPQQTQIQRDFPASVREVVISGCHGLIGRRLFYGKEEKRIAQNAMEKMRIQDLAKTCYRELSGGQQQRVLLARALCAGNRLLVLDEPVSGLDPGTAKSLYESIEMLNRQDQITVVMVTHDLESALAYASHILLVSDDYFFGTKEEYIRRNAIRDGILKGGESDDSAHR